MTVLNSIPNNHSTGNLQLIITRHEFLITRHEIKFCKGCAKDVMNKSQIQYISMCRPHGMLQKNGSKCRVLVNYMDKFACLTSLFL